MIIARITDAHVTPPGRLLFDGYDPAPALRRTLAALAALNPRPDVVLFTGDLAETGAPGEHVAAAGILASFDLPLAAIPGNHDHRAAFEAGLRGGPAWTGTGEFPHFTLEDWLLRLIGVDTLGAPGAPRGLLCDARLAWIAARLEELPDRPTVIFMHHPPFATGIGFMDAIGCENGDRLATLLAPRPQVLRALCGHVHRPVFTAFGGTIASIRPAIAYQTPLRFAPLAPVEMLFQQPAFQLHVWDPALGLVPHTDYLRDPA